MLEHSCLHVTSWTRDTRTGSTSVWLRRICDKGAHPLGFVRFAGEPRRSWFSWLRGARLDVYETEDESHLLTLIRPWGILRPWQVYDAEDRRVGSIYLPSLLDTDGHRRALLDATDRDHGIIRDPQDRVLASFHSTPATELEVIFQPELDANPFLRMLLLGGILLLEGAPSGEPK